MVNASELLINVVIEDRAYGDYGLWPKWHVVGYASLHWAYVVTSTTGGEAAPDPFLCHARNSVSPYPCPALLGLGRPTARKAVGDAGKGGWRKRMPRCNGADTGMQHARQRKLCPLPSGLSSRDDWLKPARSVAEREKASHRPAPLVLLHLRVIRDREFGLWFGSPSEPRSVLLPAMTGG